MPKYFFNIYDRQEIPDEIGTDLPDIYAAQIAAVQMSGEILRDLGVELSSGTQWRLELTDGEDVVFFAIQISAYEPTLAAPDTAR